MAAAYARNAGRAASGRRTSVSPANRGITVKRERLYTLRCRQNTGLFTPSSRRKANPATTVSTPICRPTAADVATRLLTVSYSRSTFSCHRGALLIRSNIGVLEMVTESIAADLQQQVQLAAYGTEHVYLLSHGDNSAVSDYVLNSARGTSAAMRRLASLRAARDDDGFRLSSSKHIHREFNRPADHLANEDVPAFITVMASTIPGATFVRLAVDPASASLDDVCDWSHKIALTHALHSRPSTA